MSDAASRGKRWIIVAVIGVVVLVGLAVAAYFLWIRPKPLPLPGSPAYEEYVEHFESGTAALEVGMFPQAEEHLSAAIDKIPEEPAGWANRGLMHLRAQNLDQAAEDLNKARKLAPEHPGIETLLGLLAQKQDKFDDAVKYLRSALKKQPHNLEAMYALAQAIRKAGGQDSETEYQSLMKDILREQPGNLQALRELMSVASERGDRQGVEEALKGYQELAPTWRSPQADEARAQLKQVADAAKGPLPGEMREALPQLNNLLKPELAFRRSADAVKLDLLLVGKPLYQFIALEALRNTPAPADASLQFTAGNLSGEFKADVVVPIWLTGEGKPAVFAASSKEVRRIDAPGFVHPFPSGSSNVAPTVCGIVGMDWTNAHRNDILLAGAGGLRFWQQNDDGSFTEVTEKTKLDEKVLNDDYYGAWAADVDMDGQLDIIVAPRKGPPVVLRNNGDGTFTVLKPFADIEAVRGFAWADLDRDGTPDAAFVDALGHVYVFSNEGSGRFKARAVPKDFGKIVALVAACLGDDGGIDLVLLGATGGVVLLADRDHGESWDVKEIASWRDAPKNAVPGEMRLLVADVDNNGALDLIAAGPDVGQIWLGEGGGKFTPLKDSLSGGVFAAEDLTGKGRLDLLAVSKTGEVQRLSNSGDKDYHGQSIRAFANPIEQGDNRINSFAIGSEVEAQCGVLIQKQIIASPCTHFGLGKQKSIHVLRFVWTNGAVQSEFGKQVGEAIGVEQRLKGSCPFLFAFNGKNMEFVADCMWTSPLGMFINGQNTGGVMQTQDWVKIRGDQLVPHDGSYDVRITANLWETHFFDHLALIAVDHPADTEIFVDERFAIPPVKQEIHVTSPPRPVARALDHHGREVTEAVRAVDGRYLDTAGRGKYQGVTHEHWVEIDLGDEAPREGPVWLLATGWIHPTDSSINVAISQGQHETPHGLVLEVPDQGSAGGWKVAIDNLGFPAGKNKTIMIRLDGINGAGVVRHLRLRTNMEIYWDALQYATGLDDKLVHQQRPRMESAELRYRGFLEMTRANESSPEIPHYDRLEGVGQRWRDLIGYYTRHGDVRELLAKVDDRYVIANAGDEIAMRFAVPEPPASGWKRDFVWVSDGWVKDGDYNTAFSKTVLPLPAHDLVRYDRPPATLFDDPVYQRFPDDWKKYHTRYVTPSRFERGLRWR